MCVCVQVRPLPCTEETFTATQSEIIIVRWKLDGKTLVSLSVCLPVCLPACLPASLPACLSACLPVCLPAFLPTHYLLHCLLSHLINSSTSTSIYVLFSLVQLDLDCEEADRVDRCGEDNHSEGEGEGEGDGGKDKRNGKAKGKYTIQDCIDKFVEREQLVSTE